MHPDLKALHTAVEALLKADRAVKNATSAQARANKRGANQRENIDFLIRDRVSDSPSPQEKAVERATARQSKAATRVNELWDQLNLSDDEQAAGPTYQQHTPQQQQDIATAARIHYQGRDHDTAKWQAALLVLNPTCAPGEPLNSLLLHQADQLISKQP